MDHTALINTVWVGAMALLLFFMHAGFGFYEAGMCHKKNTVDTLFHNLIILAVSVCVFWLFGGALLLGEGNGFIGLTGFAPNMLGHASGMYPTISKHDIPLAVAFAFIIFFADTPATLITGTGAERIQVAAVLILTILITGVIFPIVGHWIYGGGWLMTLDTPVYDTGGFVQLCGGCCAVAVSIMLGPRQDELLKERAKIAQAPDPIPVSSMPLVFLGAFILWLGFLAFNLGFGLHASKAIGLIIFNMTLAASFGTVAAMTTVWIMSGHPSLRATIVGMLTAAVAVTSSVEIIQPWAAAVIGIAAGTTSVLSIRFWMWAGLDDPTEYLTMNVVGGVMALFAVGLFASPEVAARYDVSQLVKPGLIYGGYQQMLTELLAAAAIIVFTLPLALLACYILNRLHLLRVTHEQEEKGADEDAHGEQAYEDPGEQ